MTVNCFYVEFYWGTKWQRILVPPVVVLRQGGVLRLPQVTEVDCLDSWEGKEGQHSLSLQLWWNSFWELTRCFLSPHSLPFTSLPPSSGNHFHVKSVFIKYKNWTALIQVKVGRLNSGHLFPLLPHYTSSSFSLHPTALLRICGTMWKLL